VNPLVVGIDPSSKHLACVAKHPLGHTMAMVKYTLGTKYSPQSAAEAMDSTLAFIDAIAPMAVPSAPRLAFIEAPLVGRGGVRTTMVQAYVSGVVQSCFVKAGFTVYLVNVQTWKASYCGNGHASKDDVRRAVAGRWPKAARNAGSDGDLIDAAAICDYGSEAASRGQVLAKRSSL
jgi:Holliday junction resolvasome RuvABC endonuclease subunit